jgi:hypothetical protein
MPIERDTVTSIPAQHLRPSSVDDGRGNMVANGPDALVTACFAGVIPPDIRTNTYRQIGGGEENLARWLVVISNAPTVVAGDAISVLSTEFVGKYRVNLIQDVPEEGFILAECTKEI